MWPPFRTKKKREPRLIQITHCKAIKYTEFGVKKSMERERNPTEVKTQAYILTYLSTCSFKKWG